MMDGFNEFAMEIKKRDNKKRIGPCTGVVKSVSPFIVTILNGEVTLHEEEELIICQAVEKVEIGEELLIVSQEDQQLFYAVAKIRR